MVAPSSSAEPPANWTRPCRKRAGHLPPPPRWLYPRRMIAFVLRRLLQSLLVILVVALVAFGLFRYVGDPINNMVGQDTSEVDRAALRQRLGLDDPVPVQFARFIGNAAHGEFGLSFRQGRKVSTFIAERLPATLEVSFVAALLALVVRVPMGVYTGPNRQRLAS